MSTLIKQRKYSNENIPKECLELEIQNWNLKQTKQKKKFWNISGRQKAQMSTR